MVAAIALAAALLTVVPAHAEAPAAPALKVTLLGTGTPAPDVGRVFSKTRTRLGVLTHLDNNPSHIPELAAQIESTWSGDFVVAEDRMAIEIGESIRVLAPGPEQ